MTSRNGAGPPAMGRGEERDGQRVCREKMLNTLTSKTPLEGWLLVSTRD